MVLLVFAFDLPLGHSINPRLLKCQGNVSFNTVRLIKGFSFLSLFSYMNYLKFKVFLYFFIELT